MSIRFNRALLLSCLVLMSGSFVSAANKDAGDNLLDSVTFLERASKDYSDNLKNCFKDGNEAASKTTVNNVVKQVFWIGKKTKKVFVDFGKLQINLVRPGRVRGKTQMLSDKIKNFKLGLTFLSGDGLLVPAIPGRVAEIKTALRSSWSFKLRYDAWEAARRLEAMKEKAHSELVNGLISAIRRVQGVNADDVELLVGKLIDQVAHFETVLNDQIRELRGAASWSVAKTYSAGVMARRNLWWTLGGAAVLTGLGIGAYLLVRRWRKLPLSFVSLPTSGGGNSLTLNSPLTVPVGLPKLTV